MSEPTFRVVSLCGHTNFYINPLPKPGEPVYCYRCVDYQCAITVEQPRNFKPGSRIRTHCLRGHLLDEKNTIIGKKSGKRACRICRNDRQKTYRKEIKVVSSGE